MARSQATKVRTKGVATLTPASSKQAQVASSSAVKSKVVQASKATQKTQSAVDQLVSQQQSTAIMQTFIHSSISCMAYLRSLFPPECFQTQIYDMNDSNCSYEEYAAGRFTQEALETRGRKPNNGTTMTTLKRGCNDTVDRFLDWLVSPYPFCPGTESLLTAIVRNVALSRRCKRTSFARYS